MNHRVGAGLLALGLIALLVPQMGDERVPWVSFSPGPTVDVLGSLDGKEIITIKGRKTYEDDGQLRLVTVYVTPPERDPSLWAAMSDWIDQDITLLPYDAVYQPEETNESSREESAGQMTSSQDSATAAALTAAGIKYRINTLIADVAKDGASEGILKKDDVVLKVNGKAVDSSEAVVAAVSALAPGSKVAFEVRRDGKVRTAVVTTRADPEDKKKSRVNVSVGIEPLFPFEVKVNLGDGIGGPSAGMMFALSIYDLLTPGALTGGKSIAGSGTIGSDGVVGGIGGIGQKLVGAQRDGAELFLVAEENCAEAAASNYDKDALTLVKVRTIADAIRELDAWSKDPGADLTECTT